MYKCNICDKDFKYKSDFRRHKNRKTVCNFNHLREVSFQCSKCYRSYSSQSNLNRHYNVHHAVQKIVPHKTAQNRTNPKKSKKLPHKSLTSDEKSNKVTITCPYCLCGFTRKDSRNRHIKKYCKVIKKSIAEKEQIYQNLLKQMNNDKQELINEISNLKTQIINNNITNNNQTNNNCNNTTNNTFNIQLVAYGKEDKESLTKKELFKILSKGFDSVPELVRAIHFDEKRPENHNLFISNMRDSYVMVFDGNRWTLVDRKETIDNILDNGKEFLVLKYDDIKSICNEKQKLILKKFNRFANQIDNCPERRKTIVNDIKMILYNGRELPLKTMNKQNL